MIKSLLCLSSLVKMGPFKRVWDKKNSVMNAVAAVCIPKKERSNKMQNTSQDGVVGGSQLQPFPSGFGFRFTKLPPLSLILEVIGLFRQVGTCWELGGGSHFPPHSQGWSHGSFGFCPSSLCLPLQDLGGRSTVLFLNNLGRVRVPCLYCLSPVSPP